MSSYVTRALNHVLEEQGRQMDYNTIRTADEREMRRLVRRGALVMAEYDWRASGVADLEQRGREWILRVPNTVTLRRAA